MIPMKWTVFAIALWFAASFMCLLFEGAYVGDKEDSVLQSMLSVTLFKSEGLWGVITGIFTPTFFVGLLKAAAFELAIFHGSWELFRIGILMPISAAIVVQAALQLARLVRGGG